MARLTKYLTALRHGFALLLAVAVLLQMGYVSVSYADCSTTGAQRIAFGQVESCCTNVAPDFISLSQKCCEVEKSEAVFFNYKDKDAGLISFGEMVAATPLAPSAYFSMPVAQRHTQALLKIPPAASQTLLIRDCRLNV
jgi:hypothetical protein